MSNDLLSAVSWFLSNCWRILTSITVPGTNINFAVLFVGLFLADLGLRFFFMIVDLTPGGFSDWKYISRSVDAKNQRAAAEKRRREWRERRLKKK